LPAGNPVVTGTTISSTTHNNTMTDMATALTNSIAKDGQTTITANLPMGTYRHTGVSNATALTDYASADQVLNGNLQYLGSVSGADTITATAAITPAAYEVGQQFSFISAGANTTAVTLNVSSLGAKAVTKNGTTALAAGDIPSGAIALVEYDGTQFQLLNVSGVSFMTAASSATLTNKTFDANGTGNSLSNVDVADLANGTDGELITWDAAGAPAVVAVGTATNVLTSNGAGAAPTFQAIPAALGTFTSSEQTISVAGGLTLAHGLGAAPSFMRFYAVCKTAELNYSIGDNLELPVGQLDSATGRGMSVVADATNIVIRFGNNGTSPFNILDKTTGAGGVMDETLWKLVAKAWL